jgi:hypothetical protein
MMPFLDSSFEGVAHPSTGNSSTIAATGIIATSPSGSSSLTPTFALLSFDDIV